MDLRRWTWWNHGHEAETNNKSVRTTRPDSFDSVVNLHRCSSNNIQSSPGNKNNVPKHFLRREIVYYDRV